MGPTKTLAAVLGILLFLALVGIAPTARADMNRPVWSPGDFWIYAFSSGQPPNPTTGTFRMDVTGTESVSVNGTSYSAYHVDATLKIPFGVLSLEIPADLWFSTETLAIVKTTAEVNFTFAGQTNVITYTISGNPPQRIQWPLRAGDAWNSTTEVWAVVAPSNGTTTYQNTTLTTDFLVQADQTVNLPGLGNFTTTPLRETNPANGTYSMNYWSSLAGNWALVTFHDSAGVEQSSFRLTSYRYLGPGLLGTTFLGLSVLIWIILAVVVVLLILAVVMLRRRRPPIVQAMPPAGYEPTMPPPAEPPQGPPEESWP